MSIAHKLIHRIEIQRWNADAGVQDPKTGRKSGQWATHAKDVYARVTGVSVREFIQSGATQVELVARIVIRYRADLLPTDRILFRGSIYNIAGMLPDPNTGLEWLTLPCSAGKGDGK